MDALKPLFLVVLIGLVLFSCSSRNNWQTASRESAGIAPLPSETREAVLQVYGADAWGWRGWFAIHTWIAAKRSDQDYYTVYDVVGWRRSVMGISRDIPDRYWYGVGSMGIHLVRNLVDDVTYHRRIDRNVLTLMSFLQQKDNAA